MICFICNKEIVGACIHDTQSKLDRHIDCIPEIIRTNAAIVHAIPHNLKKAEAVESCGPLSNADIIDKFTLRNE